MSNRGCFKKGDNKWYGAKNPFYGKKHTEETKTKMRIKRRGRKPALGTTWEMNRDGRLKISNAKMGEKNPAWKGGRKSLKERLYKTYKYSEWRQKVFIRDNFTCQECIKTGGRLQAHHKNPFRALITEAIYFMPLLTPYDACLLYTPMWDIANGKTLCEKCHLKMKRGKYK